MNFEDLSFLRKTLDLAKAWEGFTGENPSVGAVVVKSGKVLSEGVHRGPGKPHAEREAINKAISRFGPDGVRGATLYVSLEPCSTWGRTPPCADLIKEVGITRVVFGTWDPNPKNRKKILALRKSGIELSWPKGHLAKEFERFYRPFDIFVNYGRPFVVVKVAQTLNGFVVDTLGRSKWITSEKTRVLVHRRLRARSSGLMTGVGTVLADDPQLNVRGVKQRNVLLRVIVDPDLRVSIRNQVLLNAGPNLPVLIVISERVGENRVRAFLSALGGKREVIGVLKVKEKKGRLDLREVLQKLRSRMGGMYLLVEAGPNLVSSLFQERLVDRLVVCVSKSLFGGGRNWLELEEIGLENRIYLEGYKIEDLREDIWMEFDVWWNNKTY